MRPTMYLTFTLLSAVVMTVSAHPAVPTAGAVESSVSPRPTTAEGLLKLANDDACPPYLREDGYCGPDEHPGEDWRS